jgi:hypothetical protein
MRQMRVSLGTVCLLVFGMAAPMAAARAQDQGARRLNLHDPATEDCRAPKEAVAANLAHTGKPTLKHH